MSSTDPPAEENGTTTTTDDGRDIAINVSLDSGSDRQDDRRRGMRRYRHRFRYPFYRLGYGDYIHPPIYQEPEPMYIYVQPPQPPQPPQPVKDDSDNEQRRLIWGLSAGVVLLSIAVVILIRRK